VDSQTILANVLSPAALFFFLGFLSVLVHSDLELPYPLPKFFSTYLLISIGYTGGEKLAAASLTPQVFWTIAAAMGMALLVPFYTFFFLRRILSVYDAAAMAATYGSISIVTFVVGTEFLNRSHVEFGGHMVAVMSLMESPAVIMGIMLVRMFAARKAGKLIEVVGPALVAFGILAPLANAALGIGLAWLLGMGKGDALLFVLLCASSSYIVVPAAMRQAVPEANPGLFELLSLSVTFPFNISLGIPLYYGVISRVW
jgi:hypothetical protein